MRPNHVRAGALAGSLGFAFTCAAAMPGAAHAQTQGSTPTMRVSDRTLTVGHATRVRGSVDPSYAGRTAVLAFRAPGAPDWSPIATAAVSSKGGYMIRHSVPSSGTLRVTIQAAEGTATAAGSSPEVNVAVASAVRISGRHLQLTLGRRAWVTGTIVPGDAGVPVKLQLHTRHGWRTLDRARTHAGGGFKLRNRQHSTLSGRARISVGAHGALARGRRSVGRMDVYRFAQASWYGPGLYGGHLACGGTLQPWTLGVANKSLPCGAKVTLRHNGRAIRVRVIDRGPYVGGREYDLTQATAQRLGFQGHGAIMSTR